ncbi:1-phosphofructokinase [Serratia fonticola]|uniref:1-phosphofructokinase n=1 Tax=Serratia fonticola TaxID=47917 RepID=A0A4V6KPN1_SERFO|nr:1-phosphofructokinase [Serratia fonticola]
MGIANRFQVVPGRTRINVKLTEKDGEVTDFNFSGFEVTPQDWERFVVDSLSWLGQFDMVAVSGSLPAGVCPGSLHRVDDPPACAVSVHHF